MFNVYMSLPDRYTSGLTEKQKTELSKNIKKTNELLKQGKEKQAFKLAEKRPQPKNVMTRKSTFTTKLERIYKKDIPNVPSVEFEKLTGLPIKQQKEIYERGKKAFLTAGSRRGTNAFAWAKARLYAFIVKTINANKNKINKIDQDGDIFEKYRTKIKAS